MPDCSRQQLRLQFQPDRPVAGCGPCPDLSPPVTRPWAVLTRRGRGVGGAGEVPVGIVAPIPVALSLGGRGSRVRRGRGGGPAGPRAQDPGGLLGRAGGMLGVPRRYAGRAVPAGAFGARRNRKRAAFSSRTGESTQEAWVGVDDTHAGAPVLDRGGVCWRSGTTARSARRRPSRTEPCSSGGFPCWLEACPGAYPSRQPAGEVLNRWLKPGRKSRDPAVTVELLWSVACHHLSVWPVPLVA